MIPTSYYKNVINNMIQQKQLDNSSLLSKYRMPKMPMNIRRGTFKTIQVKNSLNKIRNPQLLTQHNDVSCSNSHKCQYNISQILKTDFNDVSIEPERVFFCIYRIIKTAKSRNCKPFLQYLLYKHCGTADNTEDSNINNLMYFPFIPYNSVSQNVDTSTKVCANTPSKGYILKQACANFMQQISNIECIFNGFIERDSNLFMFYNLPSEYDAPDFSMYSGSETTLWWCLIDEICNYKRVLKYPIHNSVYSLFFSYPKLIYLTKNNIQQLEIPRVLYNFRNDEYQITPTPKLFTTYNDINAKFCGLNIKSYGIDTVFIRNVVFIDNLELQYVDECINADIKKDNVNPVLIIHKVGNKCWVHQYILSQNNAYIPLSYHKMKIL